MSTKATIIYDKDAGICIEEELLDDSLWLILTGEELYFETCPHWLRLKINSILIDKIVEARNAGRI